MHIYRLAKRDKKKTLTTPLADLIHEHTRLVETLQKDDPTELADELAKQTKELKEYKEKAKSD